MTTMRRAMPEATVLYSVTAVVVAALVLWVAVVLKTAKEPWIRQAPPQASAAAGEEPAGAPATEDEAEEVAPSFRATSFSPCQAKK